MHYNKIEFLRYTKNHPFGWFFVLSARMGGRLIVKYIILQTSWILAGLENRFNKKIGGKYFIFVV